MATEKDRLRKWSIFGAMFLLTLLGTFGTNFFSCHLFRSVLRNPVYEKPTVAFSVSVTTLLQLVGSCFFLNQVGNLFKYWEILSIGDSYEQEKTLDKKCRSAPPTPAIQLKNRGIRLGNVDDNTRQHIPLALQIKLALCQLLTMGLSNLALVYIGLVSTFAARTAFFSFDNLVAKLVGPKEMVVRICIMAIFWITGISIAVTIFPNFQHTTVFGAILCFLSVLFHIGRDYFLSQAKFILLVEGEDRLAFPERNHVAFLMNMSGTMLMFWITVIQAIADPHAAVGFFTGHSIFSLIVLSSISYWLSIQFELTNFAMDLKTNKRLTTNFALNFVILIL